MAVRLRSNRSKSTSDIVDEVVQGDENCSRGESKYRTYTVEDLEEKQRRFTKASGRAHEREHSWQKSQNFVKKLIASLEKKNEVCQANDEFLTTYYKRSDSSVTNSEHACKVKLQCPGEINKSEEDYQKLGSAKNPTNADSHRKHQNCKGNVLPKKGVPVYPSTDASKQFSPYNYGRDNHLKKPIPECSNHGEYNRKIIIERRNKKYCDEGEYDLERVSDANKNEERKEHEDSSSFDPNRSRVKLEDRIDAVDSCLLNRNEGGRKRGTSERIFMNSKGDENSKNGVLKKKVSRSKSFREFFGSMIRWKRSENKERSRRYLSCDHLFDESRNQSFDAKNNEKLLRATSFQAMVFQEEDDSSRVKQLHVFSFV